MRQTTTSSLHCETPSGKRVHGSLYSLSICGVKCADLKSFSPHTSVNPDTGNKLASRRLPRDVNMTCITMNIHINYPDSLLLSKSIDNCKITIHNEDFFLRFYFFIFRERRREGEREGEKHPCVVASHAPPAGDLACNPGMCPDWDPLVRRPELNQLSHTSQGMKNFF